MGSPKSYDVVVVGAGPAGSSTALFLAQSGVSVLVIEEHPVVGEPLSCAEGVDQAGLREFFSPRANWIAAEVDGAVFRTADNRSFEVRFPRVGYILERRAFDRDLAALAAQAGAEVRVGVRAVGVGGEEVVVESQAGRERIGFRVLVGADGAASRVGSWFGLKTRVPRDRLYACAQYYLAGVDSNDRLVEFLVGPEIAPGGYGWVFPKGPGCANVGVGVTPGMADHSPMWYLERLIEWRFPKAQRLARMGGVVSTGLLERFSTDRLVLVGDAARLTDPLSGAGIINAIRSGSLSAEVVAQALKELNPSAERLSRYDRVLKEKIVQELRFRERVHNLYKRLSPEDFAALIDFGLKNFADRELSEINISEIVFKIIRSGPRFWRMAHALL